GKKSLDDFLHAFTAPALTGPITNTYSSEDVEQTLHDTYAYDWHGFFQKYVYDVSDEPPTDMIERSGWRVVWNDKPNLYIKTEGSLNHQINRWYDLGMIIGKNATVSDVRYASPAWQAGIQAHAGIVAVNGREFNDESADVLENAIKDAQRGNGRIDLIVHSGNRFNTRTISYRGGIRNPHLERIPGKPDMLAKIAAPHAR
ncbi:MAG: peptidase M61, partial [Candidatus Eremiobacteraeota bacterium]|nr:peptidase M61 [Candidatus Eremiobacteraeota bacterium]